MGKINCSVPAIVTQAALVTINSANMTLTPLCAITGVTFFYIVLLDVSSVDPIRLLIGSSLPAARPEVVCWPTVTSAKQE